ncbi:hypothetical protein [Allocoleopsis sp.]
MGLYNLLSTSAIAYGTRKADRLHHWVKRLWTPDRDLLSWQIPTP